MTARLTAYAAALLMLFSFVSIALGQDNEPRRAQGPPDAPAAPKQEFITQVYKLRFANAENVAQAIRDIYPPGEQLSMGIDTVSNSLLIRGSDAMVEKVAKILSMLDRPSGGPEKGDAETLQLRLVWLVSDNSATIGRTPVNPFDLNDEVTQALEVLGFEGKRVVCKHMTSVTKYVGEKSEFSFNVPVVINKQVVDFQGEGSISGDNPYQIRLQAGVGIDEPIAAGGLGGRGATARRRTWNMGGSIAMPLAHYVVMGTTNLVVFGGEPQTYPAALVVYLDRAPAISANSAPSAADGGPGAAPARGRGRGRGRRGGGGESEERRTRGGGGESEERLRGGDGAVEDRTRGGGEPGRGGG
ncbi:MAG: secretin N-terminal domain-containing protein [Pirellulales bacterium]